MLIKRVITGGIYFASIKLENQDVRFLCLYLMVNGVKGANLVNGLRICDFGLLAELVYGHVCKVSRPAFLSAGHCMPGTRSYS